MAVRLADGSQDLYIRQDRFHAQFAADVPDGVASLMAVSQRPLRDVALNEASGSPAWRTTATHNRRTLVRFTLRRGTPWRKYSA
jgi:hypothetical protein